MNQSVNFNAARTMGSAGMDSIEKAIYNVNVALQHDNAYLDLSDLLVVPKFSEPSVSGATELDYPTLGSQTSGILHQIGQIKKTALPPELVERFAFMQCNCLMGLFPEIKRAWLSIDSDIFMWNYEDGSDVAYFDGLSETILCAALVRPKPGIFQPHIVYLLCLATAVDVILLGVSFGHSGDETGVHSKFEEMHLLPEPLFAVPTDNIHMTAIQSTESGRIFMAGRDGCLHELYYQAEDGWFSRRCRLINHSQNRFWGILASFVHMEADPLVQITFDSSRHLLFTLSEKGDIQMFDIGDDFNSCTSRFIASMTHKMIVNFAQRVARNFEKTNFHPITCIAAVTKHESSNINLVAVTNAGSRLYFTATCFPEPPGTKHEPCLLRLVHVRLPPGFTIHSSPGVPRKVHSAFYSRGVLLMSDESTTSDSDQLWILSDDAFPFQSRLRESHEVIPLVGRTWSIAEVPSVVVPSTSFPTLIDQRPDPPSVVAQHLENERHFVVINSLGTSILTKQSPVDQLQQLLVQFGPDSEQVKLYFRHHMEQACATCLVLMCSRSLAHQQVNDIATRAFFLYSGEPDCTYVYPQQQQQQQLGQRPPINTPGYSGQPSASTPLPDVTRHLNFQQSPGASMILPSPQPSPGPGLQPPPVPPSMVAGLGQAGPGAGQDQFFGGGPMIIYSNKHRSLYLYLARLLRPLWLNRMVTEIYQILKTKEKVIHFMSAFDGDELMRVLHKLMELKDFLDANSTVFMPASAGLMSSSFAIGQNLSASQRTPYQPRMTMGSNSTAEEQAGMRLRGVAEAEENISLKQLHQLIILSCEYLGLWKILCDHQFNIIARTLNQDHQLALQNATFEQLVVNGRDICQALAKRLVDMYIDDNAATDIINGRLREVCPSLYSCHDEIYSKGYEKLKSAKTAGCGTDRDHFVAEALEQFKVIGTRVDLPSVCQQFTSLKFYNSVVDLVLTAASKRDPQNLALHYYLNKKPQADIQGQQAYNIRMDCYKAIMEAMGYLLSTTHFNPQAPSVPKSPGPPPAHDTGRLSSAEAERYIEEMYELILRSKDQMVHVAFYDWLIEKDMSENLLEIQSPYLEHYLKQGSEGGTTDAMRKMDLLWKYYEKQRNFLAAARILASLAEKPSVLLPLHQRIEYLSRAAMCAKSCTSYTTVAGEGEFLHELEEKMEVARLQLQISDVLASNHSKYPGKKVDGALERLNVRLYEISELYSEFAEDFGLYECKLAIVHCAGHFDPTLVETLWREIIDKEVEMTGHLEPIMRVQSIYTKIVDQGKKYIGSENYFPLATLVKYLEKLSCTSHLDETDATFVYRALLALGIGLPRVFDVYDKIYKLKETDWKANRKPYHLLYVICQLLNHFTAQPQIVSSNERRPFTTKALDAVASYLVELQAETTVNVNHLMNSLRDLQAHLQRVI